ncbi:MAG: DUF951 domain-containing protein [Bacillota bacterium]|jgi:hypothetical protein
MADLKNVDWAVGDVVNLKKAHPCGCNEWEITRVGMDFRIKCLGCNRYVMLTRQDFKKRVKAVVKKAGTE